MPASSTSARPGTPRASASSCQAPWAVASASSARRLPTPCRRPWTPRPSEDSFHLAREYSNAHQGAGQDVIDYLLYGRTIYHALALGNGPIDPKARNNLALVT